MGYLSSIFSDTAYEEAKRTATYAGPEPTERDSTAVFLDWDDTLFPTTWVQNMQDKYQKAGRPVAMLALTQLSNYLTLKGSFSAVSKPNFASKYALESSRRDLQNALLCTVLVGSVWVKKYTKINIENMNTVL